MSVVRTGPPRARNTGAEAGEARIAPQDDAKGCVPRPAARDGRWRR